MRLRRQELPLQRQGLQELQPARLRVPLEQPPLEQLQPQERA
jgi:hypothetical protein